jgi:hypothetical protein
MTDKVLLDAAALGQVATRVAENGQTARGVSKAVPDLTVELAPDDPLRVHPHLLAALTECTTIWGRQAGFLADAAVELVTGVNVAVDALLETDRQLREQARSIVPPTPGR